MICLPPPTRYQYHYQPRSGDLVIVHRDDVDMGTTALVLRGWVDRKVLIAIPGETALRHVSYDELEPVGKLPAYKSAEAA